MNVHRSSSATSSGYRRSTSRHSRDTTPWMRATCASAVAPWRRTSMRLWSSARATRRKTTIGSGWDIARPITATPTMSSPRSNAASTSSGRPMPISAV
jgi:hypothetical protein